jgi:hypothetical protein
MQAIRPSLRMERSRVPKERRALPGDLSERVRGSRVDSSEYPARPSRPGRQEDLWARGMRRAPVGR